jgi:redox-sensitive bicupin YhaK (pirin superfamily)
MHGFQLWVNLPARDKMIRPRYQDILAARIPAAQTADGGVKVRVVAGESLGRQAVIDTRTPIMYLHFTVAPGAYISQPVPADYNAFAYVFSGEGLLGAREQAVVEGQMALFAQDGDEVRLAVSETAKTPLEVLLIAGVPLHEPVVRYGPFVMNTEEEIYQAIEDYQNGKMGLIDF